MDFSQDSTWPGIFGETSLDDFYFNGADVDMSSTGLSLSNHDDLPWPSDLDQYPTEPPMSLEMDFSQQSTRATQQAQNTQLYQGQPAHITTALFLSGHASSVPDTPPIPTSQHAPFQSLNPNPNPSPGFPRQQNDLLQQQLQQQQHYFQQQQYAYSHQQQQFVQGPSSPVSPYPMPAGTPFEPLSPMPFTTPSLSKATPILRPDVHEHNYFAPLGGGVGYIEVEDIGFLPTENQKLMMSLFTTDGVTQQPLEIIQMALLANQLSRQKISVLIQRQRVFIKKYSITNDQEELQTLNLLILQLRQELEKQVHALAWTNQTSLLDPIPLHQMYYLHHEISLQMKQLELLHCELQGVKNKQSVQSLAVLMVSHQPFPTVISKGTQLSAEVLTVKLITAAGVEINQVSPIRAKIVCEGLDLTKGSTLPLLSEDEQVLDINTITASFPLRFNHGTRKCAVSLTFSMLVHLAQNLNPSIVQSPKSEPFVVITHENQWEDAAYLLLKKDAFVAQTEITWNQFCNTLQRHFLSYTKQNPSKPDRFLSFLDFDYFHKKYFVTGEHITTKSFDNFWTWFGKTLKLFRYQRNITLMWMNGFIYGFMNREDVHASLKNHEAGTFLVRFSERWPGQFAIGYVGVGGEIKHYLVEEKDLTGKKTLVEFLEECDQFSTVLKCIGYSRNNSTPVFSLMPKAKALQPYLTNLQSPAASSDSRPGYDPLENPWSHIYLVSHAIQGPPKRSKTGEKRSFLDVK